MQICSGDLYKPKNKIKKTMKERNKADGEINFFALGDLVGSSNKIFFEGYSLFLSSPTAYMMEWLRDMYYYWD